MKKHRKKSLFVLAWFSALFAKASPIDVMYRKAFADFALPTPPLPSGLEMAGSSVSIGLSTGAVTGIATAVGGGLLAVGTLAYYVMDDTSPTLPDIPPIIEEYIPEAPVFTDLTEDTLRVVTPIPPRIQPRPIEEIIEPLEEEEPLIVIKRTTVIDTIYED